MGKLQVNPVTGDLDLVGDGGGGGGGTVTSIGGGVGWTPTPDPIVGAGVGNLDIDKLVAEVALASGDLFPFVDVSVAGPIVNQRKTTLGDIVDFIEANIVVGCANAPDLLCLDGRAGTTNDPIISLGPFGTIYGTSDTAPTVGFGLNLNATTDTDLGPFAFNNLDANAATWNGLNALLAFGFANPAITFNAGGGTAPIVSGFNVGGTWTMGDDSLGGMRTDLFTFGPTIRNPAGVAKALFDRVSPFRAVTSFIADGAACTGGSIPGFFVENTLSAPNGGSLVLSQGIYDFDAGGLSIGAGVTVPERVGLDFFHTTGSGTIVDEIAVRCGSSPNVATNTYLSMESLDPLRQMVHTGTATFGEAVSVMEPNASIGLQVESTTRAFLTSRLTTAQVNALTAENGMLVYDTSLGIHKARQSGAWVTFPNAGTVTSVAGGVGITNTPEPIVGAGTVDLDINSLTEDDTPTSNDFFAFVDVDGGGSMIANQRKVQLIDLVSAMEDIGINADLLDGLDSTAFQPIDADLTAYAALATTGIVVRTGAGTATTRSLVQPAAGITIADADGVAGNPTFALANDIGAIEALAGTSGFLQKTAADTWALNTTVVTGTGASGAIAYWDGTQTINDDTNLLFDTSTDLITTGKILLNSSTAAQVEIISDSGGNANFRSVTYNSTAATTNLLAARRARGSLATPTAIALVDPIFAINGQGHDGNAFVQAVQIRFESNEAWDDSPVAHGTSIVFATTETGTGGAQRDRIRFNEEGNFAFQSVSGRNRNRKTFSNAAYSALATDDYVAQTGTLTASRTVTLPTVATARAGHEITIADESGTATAVNTIVVDGNGAETIDGQANKTLGVPVANVSSSITLVCTGAAWKVVATTGTVT